jgi:hypothetical protein
MHDIVEREFTEDTFGIVLNDASSFLRYDQQFLVNASFPLGRVLILA